MYQQMDARVIARRIAICASVCRRQLSRGFVLSPQRDSDSPAALRERTETSPDCSSRRCETLREDTGLLKTLDNEVLEAFSEISMAR